MRSKSNITSEYPNNNNDRHRNTTIGSIAQKDELYKQSRRFKEKQEISGYFLKCIENIKRDITRRKGMPSYNFYKEGNAISYD